MRALVIASVLVLTTPALSHDWYGTLEQPNGASCCSDHDCRPVQAHMDDNGTWHAWVDGRQIDIPRERILEGITAPDGNSHLCISESGLIYCFIRGVPKS